MQAFSASQAHQMFTECLKTDFSEIEIDFMFWHYAEVKLGFNRLDFMKNPSILLTDFNIDSLNNDLKDLLAHKPIQYVTGKAFFMDLILHVSSAVLIPRPETEELVLEVEKVLKYVTSPVIADVCTGSGCIALGLKKVLQRSQIDAIDISEEALKMARLNAQKNNLEINFVKDDALNLVNAPNRYDVVVSNPPYVLDSEKQEMKKNVLAYEPHLALFVSDEKPLLFYHAISNWAFASLKSTGWLFFEINQKFGVEIVAYLKQLGFKKVQVKKDIFEQPRIVIAQK